MVCIESESPVTDLRLERGMQTKMGQTNVTDNKWFCDVIPDGELRCDEMQCMWKCWESYECSTSVVLSYAQWLCFLHTVWPNSNTGMYKTAIIKWESVTRNECILLWLNSLFSGAWASFRGFTITLRHTTLGRTPLDEGSARRRDLYLTTHNTMIALRVRNLRMD
jgi:hypothetical protein